MCFGKLRSQTIIDPDPPPRHREIKNPDMFRTPTFDPATTSNPNGDNNRGRSRESRASGHSPSQSIDDNERRGSAVSPGRARVEEVGLEISDGPGSGLEAVPDGPVMRAYEELKVGMGSGAPEIQGLEEKTGRGGEAIVR